MKRTVFTVVVGAVLASAVPYAASAGPNGIDALSHYELNKKKTVRQDLSSNVDVLTSGSINRRYYREELNYRKGSRN